MFTGDLKPDLVLTLSASDPVNAHDALSIRVIGIRGGVIAFDHAIDPASAVVSGGKSVITMEWQVEDTANPGYINGQVEVTWPGNKKQTFPFDESIKVERDADYTG